MLSLTCGMRENAARAGASMETIGRQGVSVFRPPQRTNGLTGAICADGAKYGAILRSREVACQQKLPFEWLRRDQIVKRLLQTKRCHRSLALIHACFNWH